MAAAAMSENITIQYCMAYSRHALHSVTLPAVTSIRVSEDFVNSVSDVIYRQNNVIAMLMYLGDNN